MSLILEALRKSEAERRLGRAPDVLAAMPVFRASASRARWPLVGTTAVAAMVIAAAIAWWLHAPSPSSTRTDAQPATRAATRDAAPRRAIEGRANAAQTATTARVSATTLPAITLPTTGAPAPGSKAASMERERVAASPATPDRNAARGSAKMIAVEPLPPTIAIDVKPAAAGHAAPQAAPVIDEPALMPIAALSADARSGLPALKVSMHVYADDPAQRFMIIDGQRLGEGARIADGVTLVRIRRDGAELDVRGRRVLLPNP